MNLQAELLVNSCVTMAAGEIVKKNTPVTDIKSLVCHFFDQREQFTALSTTLIVKLFPKGNTHLIYMQLLYMNSVSLLLGFRSTVCLKSWHKT